MISVQNITKSFKNICAVDDVSFEINPGEVVGFLGPNGAGKSTTMRMITGYLKPTQGTVLVDGEDIQGSRIDCQRKIGYLPESAALYTEMEVTDYLLFIGRMRGLHGNSLEERLRIVVNDCQLASVLGRKIAHLSKGFRQRVGLAQALIHDPRILILDEPTVGLDPNQISEIRNLIKEIGQTKTVLLSTHILQEVSATCERVIIINGGKLVAEGRPEELIAGQSAQTVYELAVRAPKEAVQSQFLSWPSCAHVRLEQSSSEIQRVAVTCEGAEDRSEEIFDLVVSNGWKLSRLVKEQQSLEDVFKNLTK